MRGRDSGPTFGARRWKMAKLSYGVDSKLGPDPILRATVDFSERRPEIWPNISRQFYRVHELGDCWADVTEGSKGGTWARERYEWPNPGTVRATVQDSNIFQPGGTWELRALPKEDGGTRIDVLYHRQARGLKGQLTSRPSPSAIADLTVASCRTLMARYRSPSRWIARCSRCLLSERGQEVRSRVPSPVALFPPTCV